MKKHLYELKKFIFTNYSSIFSVILAIGGVLGVASWLKIGTSIGVYQNNFCNNILYCFMICPIYLGWKIVFQNIKYRKLCISIVLGVVFSGMMILGTQLDYYSSILWKISSMWKIILLASLFSLVTYLLFGFIERKEVVKKRDNPANRKLSLVTFCIILLVWAITYLALFPGVYGYDAPNQILQALGEIPYSVYQPIIHTFLMGKCVLLGRMIWGSYEVGLGIYSLLQLLFMVFSAAKVCMYIYQRTESVLWWGGGILFYILLPFHAVFAVSSTKDILFTGILSLFFIENCKMTENTSAYLECSRNIIAYSVLLFFMLWFRSNGIYVASFMLLFALIFLRRYWKNILLITLVPIAAFLVLQNGLIKYADVQEGNSLREMLSIPCQQIARVYTYNSDSLTVDEKEALFEIIPEDTFAVYPYRSMISDSIKGALNTDKLKSDPLKYLSLYVKIGIKNPKNYIEAAMLNCLATWYPDKYYQDERQYHPYMEVDMIEAKIYNSKYLELERTSFFPLYEKLLSDFFGKAIWTRIPIISSFFSVGSYVWILILYIFYTIYKKRYVKLVSVSILIGLMLTNILGPVSLVRYGYPIMFTIPIILMGFKIIMNEEKEMRL